jgi:hypothetical protein
MKNDNKDRIQGRGAARLVACLCLLSACAAAARAENAPAAAAVSTAASAGVDQIYSPSSKRNPLKPSTLNVDEHGPNSKAAQSDVSKATFSVYNLSLTGIMEDPRSKEAMLIDATTGLFYTLTGGKLLDAKKKQVPGVSGVIKGKQVVLITDDKKVHQLTMHKKDEK